MSYAIIVLSHLSLKSTHLEKYIIAYETTNRYSEFSPFWLKIVCTVLCRVRVCCRFTPGSSCESPRHTAVYTLHGSPSPLGTDSLAVSALAVKCLSCPWRGDRIHRRWRPALGRFFSRAVDPCVGKLLIQRGIHVGLEEQEWLRGGLKANLCCALLVSIHIPGTWGTLFSVLSSFCIWQLSFWTVCTPWLLPVNVPLTSPVSELPFLTVSHWSLLKCSGC